ncbi:hypothetical protein FE257_006136 [Aspergillus nanangensis]|uniref:Protein kinase domain-containing protein n=1 Tax=Aspergillus nanangensis TaxID=2582783 RepID=A0AAD4CPA7_ASPNN|nr:hypothetical protein FE257_006136 [Aspergillus nanangensis]
MAECPYAVGNTIKLELGVPYESLTLTVTHIFEPFTLSCTMIGQLDHPPPGLNNSMVLKIFDRRFATQLRKDWKINAWCPDTEREYLQFIKDGKAPAFLDRLRSDKNIVSEEGDGWSIAQNEAFLHHNMQHLYNTETEVYETLKDVQGTDTPRLLASFKVSLPGLSCHYTEINGIFLQYIRGFPLNDLGKQAPPVAWQSTCEQALRLVHVLTEYGILNKDVKTRNFIVQQVTEDKQAPRFHVFMIDFALCRFRREYENENEWWRAKAHQDEEGAVGQMMQRKYLKGGFTYRPSALAEWLGDQYMREE